MWHWGGTVEDEHGKRKCWGGQRVRIKPGMVEDGEGKRGHWVGQWA